jgi:hypothetical protein
VTIEPRHGVMNVSEPVRHERRSLLRERDITRVTDRSDVAGVGGIGFPIRPDFGATSSLGLIRRVPDGVTPRRERQSGLSRNPRWREAEHEGRDRALAARLASNGEFLPLDVGRRPP